MRPRAKRFVALALGSSLALAFAVAEGSSSTGNGQIVFVQNHLCQTGLDCGLGEIAVLNAQGSRART